MTKSRIKRALRWCVSAKGRHEIGAILAFCLTIYTALHRAGV